MSAQEPDNYVEWWTGLPIPWLVGLDVGHDDATSQATVLDAEVVLIQDATFARMPGLAPDDALLHIGGDRQLLYTPSAETQANFVTRLHTAWDDWARAGTGVELLTQLYWGGFTGAVIVTQNGLGCKLSGTPVAGQDPTPLVTVFNLGVIGPPIAGPARTIPSGTPWWTFDDNTEFWSRFAILFPDGMPGALTITGRAEFADTSSAAVTWSSGFTDTTYLIMLGPPIVTDGSGVVVVSVDGTTKTQTGVTVLSSANFTGHADLLAWPVGGNPFGSLTPEVANRYRSIVERWRPAKATYKGTTVIIRGMTFGWPVRTFGYGGTFGPSEVITIPA